MTEEQKMKRISEILTEAPKLTEEDLRAVNRSYPSYLFRIRKTRELYTSCCGEYRILEKEDPILDLPHAGEPKDYGYHLIEPKPFYTCPVCGKPGRVKELGRTGDRKNLFRFERDVVVKAEDGVLWGIGIHTEKNYGGGTNALTALPDYEITQYWRFEPGKAEHIKRPWWFYYGVQDWSEYEALTTEGEPLKSGWKFYDGFPCCAEYGTGYSIIGKERAAESDVGKYTWPTHPVHIGRYMRYFALCALYPRAVEMLQKAGCREIIWQMVRGKTNGLKWSADKPEKLLELSRQECRAWLGAGGGEWLLKEYKYLRRRLPTEFGVIAGIEKETDECTAETICRACARYHLPVEKLRRYLIKQRQKAEHPQYTTWKDAMEAAEALGMDMGNPLILMPGDLQGKHDEWTAAAGALRQKIAYEKYRDRLRKLTKKYTYTDGTYLIRPPVSAEEITREGKKLRHCVGGYADRHMRGATTILFLRDREKPGVPLCTIEMHGNEIMQVHGYRNEWESCPENPHMVPARELYKDILDPWLAWLKDGSRREKKKKERKTA